MIILSDGFDSTSACSSDRILGSDEIELHSRVSLNSGDSCMWFINEVMGKLI